MDLDNDDEDENDEGEDDQEHSQGNNHRRVTIVDLLTYCLQYRIGDSSEYMFYSKRLLQQLMVDTFCTMNINRLNYLSTIRSPFMLSSTQVIKGAILEVLKAIWISLDGHSQKSIFLGMMSPQAYKMRSMLGMSILLPLEGGSSCLQAMSADFYTFPPVAKQARSEETIRVCFKGSPLWHHI